MCPMNQRHVPLLNARFWIALCIASVFGANLGDFFAHNLGLGHLAGCRSSPPLRRRADRRALRYGYHALYYWLAIVIIRTAATNIGDLLAGDLKLPRPWVMTASR